MILVEAARTVEEIRRDALERLGPAFGRATLDNLFELGDQ
jgi:hypothetical protein